MSDDLKLPAKSIGEALDTLIEQKLHENQILAKLIRHLELKNHRHNGPEKDLNDIDQIPETPNENEMSKETEY